MAVRSALPVCPGLSAVGAPPQGGCPGLSGVGPLVAARRLFLVVEDVGEGEDHHDHQQDEQDLDPYRDPHQPLGAMGALAAALAVSGLRHQLGAAAVAVGLLGDCHSLIITLSPWMT